MPQVFIDSAPTPGLSEITGQSLNHTREKVVAEKLYSLPAGIFSSGGAPLPAQILAGQRRGRAPIRYSYRSAQTPHGLRTGRDWPVMSATRKLARVFENTVRRI